jgi:hypothetical protein
MSAARIKVADLVFDPDLYPRQHVDTQRVASLMRAIEGGSKLPPLVVCRSTKKIVDGVHRHQVALRREDPTIAVEFRDYATDAERYKDAVLLNSAHGLPFREVDKLRIIAMGESLGLKEIDLAGMLRTSLTHVQALKPRYATVDKSFTAAGGKLQKIPLKGSVRHLAGETISQAQADALSSAPGSSYMLAVRQVVSALQHNLLPPPERHPALWAELESLRDLLIDALSKQVA